MGKWAKTLKWVIAIVAVVILGGVFGYLKFYTWNPERQGIALVNDRKITVAQFGREIAKVPPPYQDIFKEEPKQLLDQMILKEVLLQEAKRLGVKKDPATKDEEAEISIIRGLLKKEVMDKVKVSPEEVEGVYRKHRDQIGKKPLKEMAPLIETAIREAKANDQMEEYITSLKGRAKIEINEKRVQAIAVPAAPTNTGEEFQEALKGGKPVLVDFGANSCMPCREMRPILKEVEQEFTGKARFVVLDVYKNQELAIQYRVNMLPTLIFFDKSGKEVFRHIGPWDKASIASKLKEAGAT
jgi:thioredoxin 1